MADKPRITSDELTRNLVNARKIMNKVNTGDYEKGNINEEMLRTDPMEMMEDERTSPPTKKSIGLPVGVPSVEKIRDSKLPDAIKKAMIESPIPQITLNDTLDMDFVNKTRKLMEQDGTMPVKKQQSRQVQTESRQSQPESRQVVSEFDTNTLIPIIENAIRKILDEKLSQILNAQEAVAINENLVIKVGDSLFSGKITKVKSSK
jgi:hypothetical protein